MESVMVVDSSKLDKWLKVSGVIEDKSLEIFEVIKENHYYMKRDKAECCKEVRQIIPSVIIKRNNELFTMRRLKKQFERRLHGKISIGVGGHINPNSENKQDIIMDSLQRELYEEVNIEESTNLRFIGVINDLSTEVSFYHIGLMYLLETTSDVSVREIEKMEGKWMNQRELDPSEYEMENWSIIALNYLNNHN